MVSMIADDASMPVLAACTPMSRGHRLDLARDHVERESRENP